MKIINIIGKEILDSRGTPTVSCEIHLENEKIVSASIPAGTSTGKYEANELRDKDDRLMGKGVTKAVDIINNDIAPQFLGKEPSAISMDLEMIQMDGTENKSKLGANSILAVSMAMYRAHALSLNMELFDFIALACGSDTVSIPYPMINFINGGVHADNNLDIQEFLVIPCGARNMKSAMEVSLLLFNNLKEILRQEGKSTLVGLEGGFAPNFDYQLEPFEYIKRAIEESGFDEDMFTMAIDVAASQLYDEQMELYSIDNDKKSTDDMIEWYKKLIAKYNLHSIEDGLAQDDWTGWIKLVNELGKKINIVGDDLFASNPERIAKGIEFNAANCAIIKPNQVGTITESLQAIKLCKEYGFSTIVSHRSGETNDTFIVDMAIGGNTNYIKCGGLTRGERIAKYNRLLEIERILTSLIID